MMELKFMEYKILEITYSVTESQSPPSEDQTSTMTSYLVAHVLYDYLGNIGTVDAELYKICTKSYTSEGAITVSVNTEEFPTKETVIQTITSLILEDITSIINEKIYRTANKSALSKAMTELTVLNRDSTPVTYFDGIYHS